MNGFPAAGLPFSSSRRILPSSAPRSCEYGFVDCPGAPPSPMPVSPTETHSLLSGPMRSVPPSWLPPSVRMPVSSSVRLPATTVSPDIVTRTTWLKRPVALPQPPAAGFVR